jgi:hypothetical protein
MNMKIVTYVAEIVEAYQKITLMSQDHEHMLNLFEPHFSYHFCHLKFFQ